MSYLPTKMFLLKEHFSFFPVKSVV
jgi:hypothetical protein